MRRSLAAFLLACSCLIAPAAIAASPPKQPEQGPGGTDYPVSQVAKRVVGTASAATFVFHGSEPAAAPRPVVVFLHSWGATNPGAYGGWLDHLARKGYLVLYPRFQDVNRTRPADASGQAGNLVKATLEALASDPAARPDLNKVAYIGHLAGVPIAFNLAAAGKDEGLPVPKLIFGVMPGGIASDAKARGILLSDLSSLDPSTVIITLSGDRDYLPTDRAARRLLKETETVPAGRKLFMRATSDDHGYPALTATLASPGSPNAEYDAATIKIPPDPPRDPKQKNTWRWSADMALTGEQTILTAQLGNNPTDTLDYLAFWKTFDMAADAAFAGRDAVVLARDPKFIDMGTWSDGWPVRRLSAQLPKSQADEEKPEKGPRRKLNLGPSDTRQSLSDFLGGKS
ncbi:alpha/beta hydrolase [Microvirga sp. WGZ8]|uniref:Alpha/beta hydrolase n=2 Tax=Microvirga puerhi TaxID=2876078 RepID=A0ABS7VIX7_9HYPH|nr:alpha/beta hydrolase [Microvirga puerhi]MBZ6075437.1 alpha/beta hydrolase [Microvirga puerhi]